MYGLAPRDEQSCRHERHHARRPLEAVPQVEADSGDVVEVVRAAALRVVRQHVVARDLVAEAQVEAQLPARTHPELNAAAEIVAVCRRREIEARGPEERAERHALREVMPVIESTHGEQKVRSELVELEPRAELAALADAARC